MDGADDPLWPTSVEALVGQQEALARARPAPWQPANRPTVGASYCCFARGALAPGGAGERGWAAAARKPPGTQADVVTAAGRAGAPYVPGRLALREGPLRAAALRRLDGGCDVVLVDATGRDHPLRAGLALHLGAVLDVPTIGVTDRPLAAVGAPPEDRRAATSPLLLDDELVGHWLRTKPGVRPVAVHAAWRTDPDVAVDVVATAATRARTPQPLREARRRARQARSRDGG